MKRLIGAQAWMWLGVGLERTMEHWGLHGAGPFVPWIFFFGAVALWAMLDLRDEATMTRNRGTWL